MAMPARQIAGNKKPTVNAAVTAQVGCKTKAF